MSTLSEEERAKLLAQGRRMLQARKEGNSTPTTPVDNGFSSPRVNTPIPNPVTPLYANDRIQSQLNSLNNHNNSNNDDLEQKLNAAKLNNENNEKIIRDLKQQNNEFAQKLEAFNELSRTHSILLQSYNEMEERNKELSNTVEKLRNENSHLHSSQEIIKMHEEDIDNYLNKIRELDMIKNSLNNKIIENAEMLQNALDEKQIISNNANMKISQLESELRKLLEKEETYRQLEIANVQLTEMVENSDNLLSNTIAQLQEKEKIIQSFQSDKSKEYQNLMAKIEEKEQQNVQLQTKLNQLNNSQSQMQAQLEAKNLEITTMNSKFSHLLEEKEKEIKNHLSFISQMDNNKTEVTRNMNETIEQIKQENVKLQQEITNLNTILLQYKSYQDTSEQIIAGYEANLGNLQVQVQSLKEQNEYIKEQLLLKENNAANNNLNDNQNKENVNNNINNNNGTIPAHSLKDYVQTDLRDLRQKYKLITWPDDATLEEMQESKIHQLLDEIRVLEHYFNQSSASPDIETLRASFEAVNSELLLTQRKIAILEDENRQLLYAIETGDLQPYLLLQEKKNEELIIQLQRQLDEQQKLEIEQQKQAQLAAQQSTPANSQPNNVPAQNNKAGAKVDGKKKGWFSWLR